MNDEQRFADAVAALRIILRGRVQGVGMRPTVARLADELGICGWIDNTSRGAELLAEGTPAQLKEFQRRLTAMLAGGRPPQAEVAGIESEPATPHGCERFVIRQAGAEAGPLAARVPADLAMCESCRRDLQDSSRRREGYAFVSCTDCGPRYSVIRAMPYARRRTSMQAFPLCPRCREEYQSPGDRRFHAETNACSECGPQIWLADPDGRVLARREEAMAAAARLLGDGRIVGLLGVGGYQLLCDASSSSAVRRLRQAKQRLAKPLAVMATETIAAKLGRWSALERRLLLSAAAPIVVVDQRDGSRLASEVTCGISTVGVMAPSSPLHELLMMRFDGPLACTSGNFEGDPIPHGAGPPEELVAMADALVMHDRPIERPVDDSVVRVIAGRPVSLRLARGLAPLDLPLPSASPHVALGGQLKSAVAVSNGSQAVLGPHVGSLETLAARERYVEHLSSIRKLYGVEQADWVGDLHPDYFSTLWAEQHGQRRVLQTQHHHAHAVAAMLEHQWLDRQVLGVVFDGAGYGPDGTVWGGEFLLASRWSYERVGHVRPFALPGGDRAVREIWRTAVSLAHTAGGPAAVASCGVAESRWTPLLPLLSASHTPWTSSAGRLFDAVACLALGMEQSGFEGHAAMMLESACDRACPERYALPIRRRQQATLDWRPMILELLEDRRCGVPAGAMAMKFHRGLAAAIVAAARIWPTHPRVLSGGVFQNRTLVELIVELQNAAPEGGPEWGLPGIIPPNDGGLAAGQLAIAAAGEPTVDGS